MRRQEYNLRDIRFLQEQNDSLKLSLNTHKNLPKEHCFKANMVYRAFKDGLARLKRSIGRAK